jgi:hypothetical protein
MGNHTKGIRNSQGEKLLDFAKEKKMYLVNTKFKKQDRRLATWHGMYKTPATRDEPEQQVMAHNQIDYIMIRRRQLTMVQNAEERGHEKDK